MKHVTYPCDAASMYVASQKKKILSFHSENISFI